MIILLYLTTFLAASAVSLTLLLRNRRVVTSTLLFSLLVTTGSYGRYLTAVSTTFEMARLGNLFIYVGACFCPLMIVLILTHLSSFPLPRWVFRLLTGFSFLVFFLSLTIGHSGIYYRNVFLGRENGVSFLIKEYGPLHILYPILMLVNFALIVLCLLHALRNYKQVSLHTIAPIVCLSAFVITAYLLQQFSNSRISYVSYGYLAAMLLFLRFNDRISMFDLPSNIAACIEDSQENGYIEFDTEFRCMGYNPRVRELFPEVETKWNVDDKIPPDNSFLYQEVICWMFQRDPDEKKTIRVNDSYYEMFVHEIRNDKKVCVGYMLELADRTAENKYLAAVEHYNTNLETEVRKKTERITQIRDMLVLGMSSMVGSRDDSTGGHIRRTSSVMAIFAKHLQEHQEELGITQEFLEQVTRAAPMHDLGKIAVDDAVLRKQGKFTPEEFRKMQKHPAEGARIVREILAGAEDESFVTIAENIAHYHHEKWNGQGYPCGLVGREIPLEARLMALADVFDALVSKRCYKSAFTYEQAFAIIEESLGSHFDPVLGKYFLECRPELEKMYDSWRAAGAA